MVTPASTQGSKHQYAVQSAFNTPATVGFKDIMFEGDPKPGNPANAKVEVDSKYTDEHRMAKPVAIPLPVEDGLGITSLPRQPASAGGSTWHKAAFEAAGFTCTSGNDSTAAAGAAVGAFTADDDNFGIGYCVNVQTANYGWLPTLIADYTAGAIVPAMELPEAPAEGAAINKMNTFTPGTVGMIPGAKYLTIRSTYKAQDGGSDIMYQGQDGAVNLSDLTFTHGDTLKIEMTIAFSDLDHTTGTLGENDFSDSENGVRPFHEPLCQFATSQTTWSTALTAACHKVLSMTFSWGVTVTPQAGFGCLDDTVNGIEGFMQVFGVPALTLEMAYDPQKMDDWDGSNPYKYVSVIQPGASETDAAWGLFLPYAFISEPPTPSPYGNQEHRVSVTMYPNPAGMEGGEASDLGNAPYYYCEADRSV